MSTNVVPIEHCPESPAPAWFGGNMPLARLGLILNLLVPLLLLSWDAYHGKLGADPVNFATHTTGLIAVTYLLLSLFVTPLRTVTGWAWLIQFRRSLGVYAFYYACSHLAIYFWWDRARNLGSTVYEITHRYYLTIGFLSLLLMAPLWATSLNAAIRAMGVKRWKQLHRLTYVAAGLACWHLYLQTKADKHRPEVYIAILVGLLLWRVAAQPVPRKQADQPAPEMVNTTKVVVTFAQSGKSTPLPTHQTVLEAAESIGLTIDFQCRSGLCGTCRCKLLSGQVTMPVRDGLSEEEERNGYILACQAVATENVTIDA